MSKLEILALETGLIKRYIIDKVEKNDVTFSAVARSFILLRDTQNMLNSMPDGYKAYLLKELPAEEKTQHNLERCFKDSIKKSYISFMDLLEKSQKHYRLEDSKSTAEEIKSVEATSDLPQRENNPTVYEISFARQWGALESEAVAIEKKFTNIMNNKEKIYDYFDEDDIYQKHIDNLTNIFEEFERLLASGKSIHAKAEGKIPDELFEHISTKSVISINNINKKINLLVNVIQKASEKVAEKREECDKIITSQKENSKLVEI